MESFNEIHHSESARPNEESQRTVPETQKLSDALHAWNALLAQAVKEIRVQRLRYELKNPDRLN